MSKKQKEIIEKTKTPITKSDIISGLKSLGITKYSRLEVHSSLSAFGFVVNKEYDIIDALLEVVSDGVIIMPAHTSEMTNPRDWENPPVPKDWFEIIEKNRKPFDPQIFMPERVGQVAKTFLSYPKVKRTLHPEVSLSIYNNTGDVSWYNHSFDDRELISPLYKLKEEHGKILMMGTDFFTCSSVHLSEFLSDYSTIDSYNYQIKIDDKIKKVKVITKYFDDDDMNFKAISEEYIRQYKNTDDYKQVKVGLATLTLIDAYKLYEIAKEFHINYSK
ncbi:MAG: AAC(3) family N-acetyltransferase [Candidatus Izimaplasma sp.]|nr:AAC(3) family N-acetyltransferase [Candidatus Izimaplasma bacterium]